MRTSRLLPPAIFLVILLAATVAVAWPRAAAQVPEPPAPGGPATPEAPASCGALDPSWVALGIAIDRDGEALAVGRTFSVSDGTLAVLIVVAAVDAAGAATGVDFLASVDVDAVVVQTAAGDAATHRFRPPARSGAGLTAPDGAAIAQISFCYRADATPPPLPAGAAPRASVAAAATGTAAAAATATALAEVLASATAEVGAALATADARATELAEAQATAETRSAAALQTEAARATAEALATAEAAAFAATATALVAEASATAGALAATQAAQATTLAAAQTKAAAAQETAAALATVRQDEAQTATAFAAPTATPTPSGPVAAPLYRVDAIGGFDAWTLPDGWSVVDGVLVAAGAATGWATPPFRVETQPDYAVEIEARVAGEPACRSNFGIGARGSDRGYYAAGVEWRCDPTAILWAGQEVLGIGAFAPGDAWHVYRLEVRGDTVRLLVDGALVLEITDDGYPEGGEVGVWSGGVRLEIRSFTVTSLADAR